MNISKQIEAILFFKGEPMTRKKLATLLKVSEKEIDDNLAILKTSLADRALTIVTKDDSILLTTGAEVSPLITQLIKDEINRDLGKAGLETLSIILYLGPIARRDVDYIRGVNSQFIIRNLLVRGLIEKNTAPNDQRSYLYNPSFDLLMHLGVNKVEDLPEYEHARKELLTFLNKENDETSR